MEKLSECFTLAWPKASRTTLWLLRLMLPISLAVTLLQHYGIIAWVAQYLDPIFVLMGLPGRSAVAFLTGAFVTTYAGLAVMTSLALTLREATIVAIMICICHAMVLESTVVRKTGSSFWKMAVLRFVMAFVAGAYLNLVLPAMDTPFVQSATADAQTLAALLQTWAWSSAKMGVMILAIIYALMVTQHLMEWYGMIEKLSRLLEPLMTVFGLPRRTAYMWVVGNVLGISYGSAVMLDMEESGIITREEANAVNYHLVMNHSMLEDTLV
ncbi:MAG: nucleoside recognition protein, partial [Bacteroidaceae bacterium]|nr:nucleoside recognition protein [Bacteroidaceae bacterium]